MLEPLFSEADSILCYAVIGSAKLAESCSTKVSQVVIKLDSAFHLIEFRFFSNSRSDNVSCCHVIGYAWLAYSIYSQGSDALINPDIAVQQSQFSVTW